MSWADKVWTVRDVMVEDVVTVTPATAYRRLVELLWTHGVSGLPVVEDAGRLVGIVSESDLLRVEEGTTASPPTAADIMTSPAVTVDAGAGLRDAALVMRQRGLKRLPVVDGGALVGIVSRADLLKVFLRSEETLDWDVQEVVQRHLGRARQVSTAIQDGFIVIDGEVESDEAAARLEAALRRLPGVVGVESRVRQVASPR